AGADRPDSAADGIALAVAATGEAIAAGLAGAAVAVGGHAGVPGAAPDPRGPGVLNGFTAGLSRRWRVPRLGAVWLGRDRRGAGSVALAEKAGLAFDRGRAGPSGGAERARAAGGSAGASAGGAARPIGLRRALLVGVADERGTTGQTAGTGIAGVLTEVPGGVPGGGRRAAGSNASGGAARAVVAAATRDAEGDR